ncbi:thioredoxin F1, chloroplastic-like [Rhodamnia argentea]|uniref:Thioredoxin F1, chloroplastic-like n=1 Tax=Rhodamnia argentea TaxID=178133 RepID=A0A8B8Q0Z7_9MYRT|nr:thioredoxin F1, chloroplastic-like [Rhodamnia argentea]XP_048137299.1 thioredoxin F1, chloroplastic-like [Rhodamnia argentea]
MALQLSLSNPPSLRSNSASNSALSIASSSSSSLSPSPSRPLKSVKIAGRAPRSGLGAVRCGVDTAVPAIGQVTEVDKDSFWPIVGSAGAKTVVLDMYTQWCGPCKVMAPKFRELSEKYSDVIFLKLDCNQENKPLAKELGIRVVPTFKILKDNKIVKEVTGAKFDDLVMAIETVRTS